MDSRFESLRQYPTESHGKVVVTTRILVHEDLYTTLGKLSYMNYMQILAVE